MRITRCVLAVTICVLLQVLSGAVQVAKIAIIVGLTALATDKVQKEYLARQVWPHELYAYHCLHWGTTLSLVWESTT